MIVALCWVAIPQNPFENHHLLVFPLSAFFRPGISPAHIENPTRRKVFQKVLFPLFDNLRSMNCPVKRKKCNFDGCGCSIYRTEKELNPQDAYA